MRFQRRDKERRLKNVNEGSLRTLETIQDIKKEILRVKERWIGLQMGGKINWTINTRIQLIQII